MVGIITGDRDGQNIFREEVELEQGWIMWCYIYIFLPVMKAGWAETQSRISHWLAALGGNSFSAH